MLKVHHRDIKANLCHGDFLQPANKGVTIERGLPVPVQDAPASGFLGKRHNAHRAPLQVPFHRGDTAYLWEGHLTYGGQKFYILKIQCFQKGKLFFHLFAKDVFGKLSRLDKAPQGTAPINMKG